MQNKIVSIYGNAFQSSALTKCIFNNMDFILHILDMKVGDSTTVVLSPT